MITQFILNGLVKGSLYGVAALGFAMVYNTTRIFHIAYAFFFVFAAYVLLFLKTSIGIHFIFALFICACLTGLLSLSVEKLIYQPFDRKEASNNIMLIVSLGIMIVGVNLIVLLNGSETKVINMELPSSYKLNDLIITENQTFQFLFSVLGSILVLVWLKYSSIGLKIRGLRDNPLLLRVLGKNPDKIRGIIFFVSGFLIAIPSCLLANDIGIGPYDGMPFFLNAVVALIIGGVGKFISPVIGGLILGIVQSVSVYFFEAKWEAAITFTILIFFLIFLPKGVFGEAQREV